MHGSSVVPMIKKFLSSPHVIIAPNHVCIDCRFLHFLSGHVPCNYGVFKEALPHNLFSLLNIPSIVVKGEVIPFHSTTVMNLAFQELTATAQCHID